ncbi:hypothetical protein CVS54_01431 [Microbacterium oxydans]|uniref:Uncharacterized protein n=1 Tax=Microbacterium oxydans TaxID=82380 RepID=A0A3Q9J4R5_9MICO|nr:hypothetical protein CVS54_01431 [Microbacterium oxydans]
MGDPRSDFTYEVTAGLVSGQVHDHPNLRRYASAPMP